MSSARRNIRKKRKTNHQGPIRNRLEGELKVLVGVRGQVNFVDVAWFGLLRHGVMSVSEERLGKKKPTYVREEKKRVKTLSRPGKR
jgi:hypothetical protein